MHIILCSSGQRIVQRETASGIALCRLHPVLRGEQYAQCWAASTMHCGGTVSGTRYDPAPQPSGHPVRSGAEPYRRPGPLRSRTVSETRYAPVPKPSGHPVRSGLEPYRTPAPFRSGTGPHTRPRGQARIARVVFRPGARFGGHKLQTAAVSLARSIPKVVSPPRLAQRLPKPAPKK